MPTSHFCFGKSNCRIVAFDAEMDIDGFDPNWLQKLHSVWPHKPVVVRNLMNSAPSHFGGEGDNNLLSFTHRRLEKVYVSTSFNAISWFPFFVFCISIG
jgi:hypothetical protein